MKFRGWQVLGGGFFKTRLVAGASIYANGDFASPLPAEFGRTREHANFGILGLNPSMRLRAVLAGPTRDMTGAQRLAFNIFFPQVILSAAVVMLIRRKAT